MNFSLGSLAGRVAGAPISWGVCEVPGWGEPLPPARVLAEMRSLGLAATELGAPGFLPHEADALLRELANYEVTLLGGFVPLVLHDPQRRPEALLQARRTAELFQACGATRFVTAVVQDDDWSRPVPLDVDGMKMLAEGLAQVDDICAETGLVQVLHPHVDTLVETRADIELCLAHSDVLWCLDTGHLQIGGFDPVEFARSEPTRVGHVHLKDVTTSVAARVLHRDISLLEGVRAGLFQPLGRGDVAVGEVVNELEAAGYTGWYVLEQDAALSTVPPAGAGPVMDVAASLSYLASLDGELLDRSSTRPRIPGASNG